MAVVSRQLYDQTVAEITSVDKPVHWTLEVELLIGTEVVIPRKIVSLEEVRDFENSYCDQIFASVYMTLAVYEEKIYPNRNDLKMLVRRIPIFEGTEKLDHRRDIQTFTYRAVICDIKEDQLTSMPAIDGQLSIRRILFQLIELGIDELRLTMIGGVFVNERSIDVIRTLLGVYSDRLNLSDEHRIKGVEYREPNVTAVRKNTILPHGITLMDMPGYIQKHCGGVYNYGLGFFLHRRVWYVYPLYNSDQYETSRYRLDVVMAPPNAMPGHDRTWMIKGQTLFIMATGDRDVHDKVDQLMQNEGNGIAFGLASHSFTKWAEVKGNVATAKPSQSVAQYRAAERRSKMEAIPFSANRLTDNVAQETSVITKREGRYVQLAWENAMPKYLYPGMPTKIRYESALGIEEHYGVLLRVESMTATETKAESAKRYRTGAVLTVFIKPRDHAPS